MKIQVSYPNGCEELAKSISPWTLNAILEDETFSELIECFRSFSETYVRSRTEVDVEFIRFSRGVVLQTIKQCGLMDRYLFKLSLYKRLAEYKIRLVEEVLCPQLLSIEDRLREMSVEDAETMRRNWILRNSLLCSSISQIFFCIEHCCKIVCSLGNVEFAQKVACDKIIQHENVFKTLREFGGKRYLLDFDALRRLYAYAIKTRMVADYTDFFHERYNGTSFLFHLFLPVAYDIFNSQKQLLFECAGI